MILNIDQKIFEQYPDLKLGVFLIKGMNNSRRVSDIESLLRGISAQRGREFAQKDIHEDPFVKVWDQVYGNFGVNPIKHLCSVASLLQKVKELEEIPHNNLLIDLYNYFSLKYLLPIGGEDLDWLYGDLNLTYTKGDEPFRPVGSIDVQRAKEGEIAYMDNGGITRRYWNHKDCERTKFTEKTVNAAVIVEDLNKTHMDEFGRILYEIEFSMNKYIGGDIQLDILTEDSPTIDLGIEGRRNVDDSKVPQQEKAYFLEMEKLKNKAEE